MKSKKTNYPRVLDFVSYVNNDFVFLDNGDYYALGFVHFQYNSWEEEKAYLHHHSQRPLFPIKLSSRDLAKPTIYILRYENQSIALEVHSEGVRFKNDKDCLLLLGIKKSAIFKVDWSSRARVLFIVTNEGIAYKINFKLFKEDVYDVVESPQVQEEIVDYLTDNDGEVYLTRNNIIHFKEGKNRTLHLFDRDPNGDFKIKLPSWISANALFYTYDYSNGNNRLWVKDSSSERWFAIERAKSIKDQVVLTPALPYEKIPFPLTSVNDPNLFKHYLFSEDHKLYRIEKNDSFKLLPVVFPFDEGEAILRFHFARGNSQQSSLFVLTNQGRLFGLGDNREGQLKNGELAEEPWSNPILLNHIFGQETTKEFYLKLLHRFAHDSNRVQKIIDYFPDALFEDEDFLAQIVSVPDYGRRYSVRLSKQKLFALMKKSPKDCTWLYFENRKRLIDVSDVAALCDINQDFILYFYNEHAIKTETFVRFLEPIIKREKKQINTLQELLTITDANGSPFISEQSSTFPSNDVFKLLSPGFFNALAHFNFHFDFIAYHHVLNLKVFNEFTPSTLNKIQEEAILDIPVTIPLNDQVAFLVKSNFYVLAKRLIESQRLPKVKLIALFKKAPDSFSTSFRTLLLASEPKKAVSISCQDAPSLVLAFYGGSNINLLVDRENRIFQWGVTPLLTSKGFGDNTFPTKPTLLNSSLFKNTSLSIEGLYGDGFSTLIKTSNNRFFFIDKGSLKETFRYSSKTEIPIVSMIYLYPDVAIWLTASGQLFAETLLRSEGGGIESNIPLVFHDSMIGSKRKTIVDITSIVPLKNGERIIEIKTNHLSYLIVRTSLDRLLVKQHQTSIFQPIVIPLLQNEHLSAWDVHALGVLITTSQARVFLSPFNVNHSFVVPWYDSLFSNASSTIEMALLNLNFKDEERIAKVGVNHEHGALLTTLGNVFLFGGYGLLGTSRKKYSNKLELSFLKKQEKIIDIYLAPKRTFLITNQGRYLSFGDNDNYSLGDGTKTKRYYPIDITKSFKGSSL
jgi:hypothetical protein